ncbi:MAG: DUF3592 domain-containing protein [Desulfococcaceae bacterium]
MGILCVIIRSAFFLHFGNQIQMAHGLQSVGQPIDAEVLRMEQRVGKNAEPRLRLRYSFGSSANYETARPVPSSNCVPGEIVRLTVDPNHPETAMLPSELGPGTPRRNRWIMFGIGSFLLIAGIATLWNRTRHDGGV